MPTAPGMMAADANNLTEQCDWFSEENRTNRVTERLDTAGCLFLSILPYGQAVSVLIWIFVLLTVFSFLINGVTLFGIGRSEDLSWDTRVAFFKNLILSDLLQTVTIGPTVIYSLVQRRTIAFSTWCHTQYFVGTVCIFSSLLTITCMALERYVYVCHAIRYLVIITQVRLRLALIFIWVYSIIFSTSNMLLVHNLGRQNNETVTSGLLCEPDIVERHMGSPRAAAVFRKLLGFFTLLMCLLVNVFCYLRMYKDARNAVVPFHAVNTKARKTVLFYLIMLFLQLFPLVLKVTSDALSEVESTVAMMALPSQVKPKPSYTAAVLHMSMLVMLLVPPCINPLVYGLRNAEMRRSMLSLFRLLRQRRGEGARVVEEIRMANIVPQNRAQAG
ncbi:olfactory receptor 14I1 [Perca flavescens]|uniref:olfactory receptor 14I1 n=1 Tax=Perca flavescens TaxID=8167 RepID=UPI00106E6804|nr:olfactory receptor 14I1-like [Perca flavescens]